MFVLRRVAKCRLTTNSLYNVFIVAMSSSDLLVKCNNCGHYRNRLECIFVRSRRIYQSRRFLHQRKLFWRNRQLSKLSLFLLFSKSSKFTSMSQLFIDRAALNMFKRNTAGLGFEVLAFHDFPYLTCSIFISLFSKNTTTIRRPPEFVVAHCCKCLTCI
jgi:hypothetical protein